MCVERNWGTLKRSKKLKKVCQSYISIFAKGFLFLQSKCRLFARRSLVVQVPLKFDVLQLLLRWFCKKVSYPTGLPLCLCVSVFQPYKRDPQPVFRQLRWPPLTKGHLSKNPTFQWDICFSGPGFLDKCPLVKGGLPLKTGFETAFAQWWSFKSLCRLTELLSVIMVFARRPVFSYGV